MNKARMIEWIDGRLEALGQLVQTFENDPKGPPWSLIHDIRTAQAIKYHIHHSPAIFIKPEETWEIE